MNSHFIDINDPISNTFYNIGCNSLKTKNLQVDNLTVTNLTSTGLITANNIAATGTANLNIVNSNSGNANLTTINTTGIITVQNTTTIGVGGINTQGSYFIDGIDQFRFPKQISIGGNFITFPLPVGFTNIYCFNYLGTSNQGVISSMKLTIGIFTKSLTIQVIDVTNSSNVICQAGPFVGPDGWYVVDLGTISNLPANPAVFFMNVAAGTGSLTSQVGSLLISFDN
jgi:hypothetical protein